MFKIFNDLGFISGYAIVNQIGINVIDVVENTILCIHFTNAFFLFGNQNFGKLRSSLQPPLSLWESTGTVEIHSPEMWCQAVILQSTRYAYIVLELCRVCIQTFGQFVESKDKIVEFQLLFLL